MNHFDFLGKTKYFLPVSILLIIVSIVILIPQVRGLNPGIDFTGGTEFTVVLAAPVDTATLRRALGEIPAGETDLSTSVIQEIAGGGKKVITTQLHVEKHRGIIDRIEAVLHAQFPVTEISRRSIGEQVSRELIRRGWQAILLAIMVILVYVSWRFRLRYAVGAVAAVLHDVIIALGLFALFRVEVNLATIAAFLTIVGYSLNDTIVIFDRIRENTKLSRKSSSFNTINLSVSQSLSRTLNTSITTLIPVIILFIFGGVVLRGFSLALLIGVVIGTYSSMYIANPILYTWTVKAEQAKQRG